MTRLSVAMVRTVTEPSAVCTKPSRAIPSQDSGGGELVNDAIPCCGRPHCIESGHDAMQGGQVKGRGRHDPARFAGKRSCASTLFDIAQLQPAADRLSWKFPRETGCRLRE